MMGKLMSDVIELQLLECASTALEIVEISALVLDANTFLPSGVVGVRKLLTSAADEHVLTSICDLSSSASLSTIIANDVLHTGPHSGLLRLVATPCCCCCCSCCCCCLVLSALDEQLSLVLNVQLKLTLVWLSVAAAHLFNGLARSLRAHSDDARSLISSLSAVEVDSLEINSCCKLGGGKAHERLRFGTG